MRFFAFLLAHRATILAVLSAILGTIGASQAAKLPDAPMGDGAARDFGVVAGWFIGAFGSAVSAWLVRPPTQAYASKVLAKAVALFRKYVPINPNGRLFLGIEIADLLELFATHPEHGNVKLKGLADEWRAAVLDAAKPQPEAADA